MSFCPVTGKVIHKDANSARNGVSFRSRAKAGRPYRCRHCNGWHVTHWRAELKPQEKWARAAFGDA